MTDQLFVMNILFNPDFDGFCKRLHVRSGSPDSLELRVMLDEAVEIARPIAIYRSAQIEKRESDWVVIAGIIFHSHVLSVNLEKAQQVFPFVASCGMELQEWGDQQKDLIRSYWAEAIKEEALLTALAALRQRLEQSEGLQHSSTMSPGSLDSWPISEQAALFQLLGNATSEAKVRLTEDLLMIPTKSVSGIIFPLDESFESCMLCQRENCPNRRAPYDETLFEREYCPATK